MVPVLFVLCSPPSAVLGRVALAGVVFSLSTSLRSLADTFCCLRSFANLDPLFRYRETDVEVEYSSDEEMKDDAGQR
jgi:hypothetical protein